MQTTNTTLHLDKLTVSWALVSSLTVWSDRNTPQIQTLLGKTEWKSQIRHVVFLSLFSRSDLWHILCHSQSGWFSDFKVWPQQNISAQFYNHYGMQAINSHFFCCFANGFIMCRQIVHISLLCINILLKSLHMLMTPNSLSKRQFVLFRQYIWPAWRIMRLMLKS